MDACSTADRHNRANLEDRMKLALAWNRIDFANKERFSDCNVWKVCF